MDFTGDIVTAAIAFAALGVSIVTYHKTHVRDKKRDTIKAYEDLQEYLYHFYEYGKNEIENFVDDKELEEYGLAMKP